MSDNRDIPLFKVHIDVARAVESVTEVLQSGFLNEGVQVTQLTHELSLKLNSENLILLNSCTSALTLALRLANTRPFDSIVTTAMTCVATNMPIAVSGASIVWADIDPETGCIDPDSVDEALDEDPNVRAVIAVAWAGNPPDLERLKRVCELHGAKLILDAAHALGASYKGKPIHEWADYTCYSLQAIKHVTSGDGGVLVCGDEGDLARAKRLKWFGIDRDAAKDTSGNWKGQHWEFDISESGYKFNMNNLCAAVGLSQLGHYDSILRAHVDNAASYGELLDNNRFVRPLKSYPGAQSAHWVYTVLLKEGIDKLELLKRLNEHGVRAGLVHVPNHNYECFQSSYRVLPGVDAFHSAQFSLPCGWWVTRDDVEFIVGTLSSTCEVIQR